MLLADEPTSGLDSFQAYSIMLHLSQLAKLKKMSILCAIHQPRSSIWNLFDDIILLAPGGLVVYSGSRLSMIDYFKKIGFSCPINTNPAEYFIDLVSYNTSSETTKIESKQRIETLVEHFQIYHQHQKQQFQLMHSKSSSPFSQLRKTEPSNTLYITNNKLTSANTLKPMTRTSKQGSLISSIFRHLRISLHRTSLLFLRSYRQAFRDFPTLLVRLLTSGVLAVIVSSVYGERTGARELSKEAVGDRVNILGQAVVQVGR